MSETLEELKAIVDNAPDGAVSIFENTYIDGNGRFYSDGAWFGVNGYIEIKQPTRSLSDIKLIIDLIESSSGARERYIRNIERQRRYINP